MRSRWYQSGIRSWWILRHWFLVFHFNTPLPESSYCSFGFYFAPSPKGPEAPLQTVCLLFSAVVRPPDRRSISNCRSPNLSCQTVRLVWPASAPLVVGMFHEPSNSLQSASLDLFWRARQVDGASLQNDIRPFDAISLVHLARVNEQAALQAQRDAIGE